jgi:hypothetical protein
MIFKLKMDSFLYSRVILTFESSLLVDGIEPPEALSRAHAAVESVRRVVGIRHAQVEL